MSTTFPASHLDLLQSPLTGAFATIGADGKPQLTALWYLLDDEVVNISVNSTRQKLRNLQARPVATLLVIDPANADRTIEVRGDVTLVPDPDKAFADRISEHYGHPLEMRNIDRPGDTRWIVVLTPTRVNTAS